MSGVCPQCGLSKDLCTCETLEREKGKITVTGDTKRYGKYVTQISGISEDMESEKILKKLKRKLACGGTIKNGKIELQGNHKKKLKKILVKMGFSEDQIEVR